MLLAKLYNIMMQTVMTRFQNETGLGIESEFSPIQKSLKESDSTQFSYYWNLESTRVTTLTDSD